MGLREYSRRERCHVASVRNIREREILRTNRPRETSGKGFHFKTHPSKLGEHTNGCPQTLISQKTVGRRLQVTSTIFAPTNIVNCILFLSSSLTQRFLCGMRHS